MKRLNALIVIGLAVLVGGSPVVRAEDPMDDMIHLGLVQTDDNAFALVPDRSDSPRIQTLIDTIADSRAMPKDRKHACLGLMDRGSDKQLAKGALLQAMKDKAVRVDAAAALLNIETAVGPKFEAPPALALYLPDPSSIPLSDDAKAALTILVDAMGSDDTESFTAYIGLEYAHGYAEQVTPLLLSQLRAGRAANRKARELAEIVTCIGKIGPGCAQAGPEILPLLDDPDPELAAAAVLTISRLAYPPARLALLRILKGQNPKLQNDAATALLESGPTQATLPAEELASILKQHPWNSTAEWAIRSLGEIGPAAAPAVPALIVALHDPKLQCETQICKTLGQIGPAAKAALPDLSPIMKNRKLEIWAAAAEATAQIAVGPEQEAALAILDQGLAENTESGHQETAAITLLSMHHRSGDSAAVLLGLLTHQYGTTRFHAANALRDVTSADADAAGVLERALTDRSIRRRVAAADALGRIGRASLATLPALKKMGDSDPNPWARMIALLAVDRISASK